MQDRGLPGEHEGVHVALTTERERAYHREWKQRIRDAFVESRGGACERCKADPGAYGLVVDYLDQENKPGYASKIWSMAKARRDAELELCIVLCRACYLKHTEPAHGTVERYVYTTDPCRCRACRDAQNAYLRTWKARRKEHVSTRVSQYMMDEPWREELQAYPLGDTPKSTEQDWWTQLGGE